MHTVRSAFAAYLCPVNTVNTVPPHRRPTRSLIPLNIRTYGSDEILSSLFSTCLVSPPPMEPSTKVASAEAPYLPAPPTTSTPTTSIVATNIAATTATGSGKRLLPHFGCSDYAASSKMQPRVHSSRRGSWSDHHASARITKLPPSLQQNKSKDVIHCCSLWQLLTVSLY